MKLLVIYCTYLLSVTLNRFAVVAKESGFDNDGVVAAFGDYNADKLVDIFVINANGII